jgi:PAS domain S-box-containing protein
MTINDSERGRIDQIIKAIDHEGVQLSDFSNRDYPAVALHSNSTLIATNAEAEKMFGFEPGEMVYLNAWTLFPPESGQALMQHLVSHSEEPYQVNARRKDGSIFRVELMGKEFLLKGELIRAVVLRQVAL